MHEATNTCLIVSSLVVMSNKQRLENDQVYTLDRHWPDITGGVPHAWIIIQNQSEKPNSLSTKSQTTKEWKLKVTTFEPISLFGYNVGGDRDRRQEYMIFKAGCTHYLARVERFGRQRSKRGKNGWVEVVCGVERAAAGRQHEGSGCLVMDWLFSLILSFSSRAERRNQSRTYWHDITFLKFVVENMHLMTRPLEKQAIQNGGGSVCMCVYEQNKAINAGMRRLG